MIESSEDVNDDLLCTIMLKSVNELHATDRLGSRSKCMTAAPEVQTDRIAPWDTFQFVVESHFSRQDGKGITDTNIIPNLSRETFGTSGLENLFKYSFPALLGA